MKGGMKKVGRKALGWLLIALSVVLLLGLLGNGPKYIATAGLALSARWLLRVGLKIL